MGDTIEIYTKDHCPYCQRAKELLRIKGVAFVEYGISDDPARAEELFHRSQRYNVPEVFAYGHRIGDCSDLFNLDERGLLNALLGLTPAGE